MKLIISLFFVLFIGSVEAKIKINKLGFDKNASFGTIVIETKGKLLETPELLIKGNIVQVTVPSSFVWPKIDKKVGLINSFDTNLMAYQFDKDVVRVRAVLPYSVKGSEGKVSLLLEDNKIILNFPIVKRKLKIVKTKVKKSNINNTAYDERYLESLLADSKESAPEKNILKKNTVVKDEVKVSASAPERNILGTKSDFSLWTYILKFLAFLAVVLVFFYGVIFLMRKGVMKKGKLGFFNSSNIVEVLSTTHVGPKKSLLLVKAHKQVFLVSSTDKGMEFLSEITDVTGLIKNEEKEALGTNFDLTLAAGELEEKNFKMKEDVPKKEFDDSYRQGVTPKKAVSKYSDQIKNKLKNLKPLQ